MWWCMCVHTYDFYIHGTWWSPVSCLLLGVQKPLVPRQWSCVSTQLLRVHNWGGGGNPFIYMEPWHSFSIAALQAVFSVQWLCVPSQCLRVPAWRGGGYRFLNIGPWPLFFIGALQLPYIASVYAHGGYVWCSRGRPFPRQWLWVPSEGLVCYLRWLCVCVSTRLLCLLFNGWSPLNTWCPVSCLPLRPWNLLFPLIGCECPQSGYGCMLNGENPLIDRGPGRSFRLGSYNQFFHTGVVSTLTVVMCAE